MHWLTVDLPETIELRRRLLPPESPRQRMIGASALERTWLDEVDPARGLMITAQGLLMYLEPADVHRLVGRRSPAGSPAPRWCWTASRPGSARAR